MITNPNIFLSFQSATLPVSPIQWLRNRVNNTEIKTVKIALLICKLIPSSCPFARTIKVFGKTLLVIPPLCHLNPLYEELMGLRFRALSFLSESNFNY
jgi:hypothetical protein